MKRVSQCLTLICVALLSIAMLTACATAPPEQPQAGGGTPGLYKSDAYGFTLKYPENFKSHKIRYADEVCYVAYPNQWDLPNIGVSVSDLYNEALDPEVFMDSVKATNPGTKRFKVLSQKDMTLSDGTPAKSFIFKWNWSDGVTKLQSASLITNKGGKSISCTATTVLGGDTTPEVLQSWCDTLDFE